MPRFTKLSITMLGLVVGPACASIVGIDTNHSVGDSTAPTSTSSQDGSSSGTSSSSGASGTSGTSSSGVGPDAANPCEPCLEAGFTSCNVLIGHTCVSDCDTTTATCPTQFACPAGWDCQLNCKSESCKAVQCAGGNSCTLDCTTGNCTDAKCASPTCTFKCGGQGNACAGGACVGANVKCDEVCLQGAAQPQECRKFVSCCDPSQCPVGSACLK